MKTKLTRLICFLFAIFPMMAAAQSNIKSAFEAIIKCQDAKITEKHELDKDPYTHLKTGQSDVYSFVLPAQKMDLVQNVLSAFTQDSEVAYYISQGWSRPEDQALYLLVGDASNQVKLTEPNSDYVYALFLPEVSEDPEGIFRYAYGMNFKEEDDKIIGKLVVTYAFTLKHRQELREAKQNELLRSMSNGSSLVSSSGGSQKSWFENVMSYFLTMNSAVPEVRISLATKAYELIHDSSKYPDVKSADKEAIRDVLKVMISDKKYSEPILNKLLNHCMIALD